MLSIGSLSSAGQASSYYTKDNYYTADAAEAASSWEGKGAAELGLSGGVNVTDFASVLAGTMPDGSTIPAGPGGKHRPGIDLTFSAPKSLSLLAYIGGDERLLEANMAAAKATIAWAEKNLAQTRMLDKNGELKTVKTGNLIAALFQHDTNRNLEPQAHVHAVIANATQGKDGKWRALANEKLWTQKTNLASIYNAHLRKEVERLGYGIELTGKHGQFEIAGVSREAVMLFSSRREEILEAFATLTHQNDKTRDLVTLKTRARKEQVEDRTALRAEWAARAAGAGLDFGAMVAAARERADGARDVWGVIAGVATSAKDMIARAVTIIGERLGSSERDPLMPRSTLGMSADEIAAARSIASAVRSLSEREAAFDETKIVKTALDLGLPITVDQVERSVHRLVRAGLLVRGRDNPDQLTTRDAISAEQALLGVARDGRGRVAPVIADAQVAGERLKAAARTAQGFALNKGQENAGRLILSSPDLVVAVQGVAGAGKSSALAAVAAVAREEGRNVLGLGPQNTLVRMLERDTGIASMTIDKFIRTHRWLLGENVRPDRLGMARAMFRGSVILVDEASMMANDKALMLARLAARLEVGRLAFVGDKRQLGAVDAGKPFELLQAAGIDTAKMNINLRARAPELKMAAAAANDYRPADALAALRPFTVDAPGQGVRLAVAEWLSRSPDQRDATMLLASGRAIRDALNAGIQAGLRDEGTLSGHFAKLTVLTKVVTTREEERYLHSYRPGLTVELQKDLPSQGIAAGRYVVAGVDQAKGVVTLKDARGCDHSFRPSKLATNRDENSVRISDRKELRLHEGDTIRWTDTDGTRGLINADRARVLAVATDGITFETSTKMVVTLPAGDRMLERLDLGYALNAHMAQGLTADRAIAVMDSTEKNLSNQRLFLVNITRVRDELKLIVDDSNRITRQIERNTGDKTSALETTGEVAILRFERGRGGSTLAAPDAERSGTQPAPPASEPQSALSLPKPTETKVRQPPERQRDFGL